MRWGGNSGEIGFVTSVRGAVAAGFERVREAFGENFESGGDVGAALCVYRHGRKVVDLRGGLADAGAGRPWAADTLQLVYSATKAATATCAHLLAQRGELDLDAPVARYWPEFAAAGKAAIPVRWLLSHRAGLPVIDHPITLPDIDFNDPAAQAAGTDRVLLIPTRFSSGFMLPTDESPLGGPASFGHPGRGGSLGFADPDSGIAFGYVVSHIRQDMNDTRAATLAAAVRACLR